MNKDEQLVVQVLNAYKNGKIDFSKVPELEILIRQEVNKDFRDYQQKIEAVANQKIEEALQEQLHRLDAENLKTDVLKEIQKEKQDLLVLKKELQVQREKTNIDTHREALESYSIIIANIVCLLCFLVVGALLGQWIYKGIWDGWGLHLLYDTVLSIQPEHPYGAVVLGLGGFGLIGAGIYGSFRLMYEASTTWLDQRPKIFKRIFPKK
ncbi:mobilization protein (plasmid) [Lactococcus lactis subsp. lactis]|uniref:mobilization protein n=1 Tax=Lactococcus lactis TaxID=1358 RepID=UPI0009BD9B1D|nr:mobilization protein [Lactococcus lactis]ARE12331.2 mobilization protein [Lactococcus lactis subsp. lactis]ARE14746.1 mobilization protein [Lactococcus lactis subsp. lactis]